MDHDGGNYADCNISNSSLRSFEDARKMSPYEFWRSIGSPQKVVAPMVEHSDLAFRMLTRKYGADLVYTQMYNANAFTTSAELREQHFTTCAEDRPLIVQFAGHDPQLLLQAARYVEDKCDAVDLNLGCPQGIAKRGRYGAFLMEEQELLFEIVSTLVQGLKVPVTCKIRIFKDFEKTIEYCELLVRAGASMLTVHGRTREEKGHLVRVADWDTIRRIKEHFANRAVPVPILANGGIESLLDVERCLQITGCDGAMSSEAILENPAIFASATVAVAAVDIGGVESAAGATATSATASAFVPDSMLPVINLQQIELTEEYLRFCELFPVRPFKAVRSHINKMLYRYINYIPQSSESSSSSDSVFGTELRESIGNACSIPAFYEICSRCRQLVLADSYAGTTACRWYRRYRQQQTADSSGDFAHPREREKLVNLESSFLSSGSALWNAEATDENDDSDGGGGVLDALFQNS